MTAAESLPITVGRRLYVRLGITLVALAAAGGMVVAHRATLDSGTDRLAAADGEWLVLACLAAVGTWVGPGRRRDQRSVPGGHPRTGHLPLRTRRDAAEPEHASGPMA
ncbi:hypothetical protein [Streptomyces violaceusniger]|uniref:hypothetical protein n=1 Tax=Streptomyces violaceusniger TaxID=68280 RepID=UPI0001E4B2B8|nr:hypothetical protein [Streptomyces violaceusniger]